MKEQLQQENEKLKNQIAALKIDSTLWKLHAILGSADYEDAMSEVNQLQALTTLIVQLDYGQEVSPKTIELLNYCVKELQKLGYFDEERVDEKD